MANVWHRGFLRLFFSIDILGTSYRAGITIIAHQITLHFYLKTLLYSLWKATPDDIERKRSAGTKASLKPLGRHISICLQPNLNIISVPLDPSSFGTNSIQTSSQCLIKSFLTLVFKEPLDICNVLLGSERSCKNGDDTTEHQEGGRESLDQSVPVLLYPGPKGFRTGGVGAENPHWIVDLGVLVCGWLAWGMGYLRLVP